MSADLIIGIIIGIVITVLIGAIMEMSGRRMGQ